MTGLSRRVLAIALSAISVLGAASTSAHANDFSVSYRTEPAQPVPGQPFTLVAEVYDASGNLGAPSDQTFSFDLDGDDHCETTPSSESRVALTRPAGVHSVRICPYSSRGTSGCVARVLVGAAPDFTMTPTSIDSEVLRTKGVTATLKWNMPVTVGDYSASIADTRIVGGTLDATVLSTSGTETVIRIAPPPAGVLLVSAPAKDQQSVQLMVFASVRGDYEYLGPLPDESMSVVYPKLAPLKPTVALQVRKRKGSRVRVSGTAVGCQKVLLTVPGGRILKVAIKNGRWSVDIPKRRGRLIARCRDASDLGKV